MNNQYFKLNNNLETLKLFEMKNSLDTQLRE